MRMPDRVSVPGVVEMPDALPLLPVVVPLSWGGWWSEVAAVMRRSWKLLAGVVVAVRAAFRWGKRRCRPLWGGWGQTEPS